jgi:hypothetical protein
MSSHRRRTLGTQPRDALTCRWSGSCLVRLTSCRVQDARRVRDPSVYRGPQDVSVESAEYAEVLALSDLAPFAGGRVEKDNRLRVRIFPELAGEDEIVLLDPSGARSRAARSRPCRVGRLGGRTGTSPVPSFPLAASSLSTFAVDASWMTLTATASSPAAMLGATR